MDQEAGTPDGVGGSGSASTTKREKYPEEVADGRHRVCSPHLPRPGEGDQLVATDPAFCDCRVSGIPRPRSNGKSPQPNPLFAPFDATAPGLMEHTEQPARPTPQTSPTLV